jgi:hypothetical protein
VEAAPGFPVLTVKEKLRGVNQGEPAFRSWSVRCRSRSGTTAACYVNSHTLAVNRRVRGGQTPVDRPGCPILPSLIRVHCLTVFRSTDKESERSSTVFKPNAHTVLGTLLVLAALALPMYAAAGNQMPLNGPESGTFQILGPCESSGIVVDVTGTGHATLVGKYSVHYRECLFPATGAVTDGSFTLTAANGDTLSGTYAGQAVPTGDSNVIAFDDPGVITDGTGRFAGASGIAKTAGVANLATGEYTSTISGNVSSAASA